MALDYKLEERKMKIFAFEWCYCIFESDFTTVSLHKTKAGAYRAMRKFLLNEYEASAKHKISGSKPLEFQDWRISERIVEE